MHTYGMHVVYIGFHKHLKRMVAQHVVRHKAIWMLKPILCSSLVSFLFFGLTQTAHFVQFTWRCR